LKELWELSASTLGTLWELSGSSLRALWELSGSSLWGLVEVAGIFVFYCPLRREFSICHLRVVRKI
jgi:hypothetical protein